MLILPQSIQCDQRMKRVLLCGQGWCPMGSCARSLFPYPLMLRCWSLYEVGPVEGHQVMEAPPHEWINAGMQVWDRSAQSGLVTSRSGCYIKNKLAISAVSCFLVHTCALPHVASSFLLFYHSVMQSGTLPGMLSLGCLDLPVTRIMAQINLFYELPINSGILLQQCKMD